MKEQCHFPRRAIRGGGDAPIVFVLATATSMIALTVHGDHAHIDLGGHTAGQQKTALLY